MCRGRPMYQFAYVIDRYWPIAGSSLLCTDIKLFFMARKNVSTSDLKLGPDRNEIFGADANTDIREEENSNIQYMGCYSIYNILNLVMKYM